MKPELITYFKYLLTIDGFDTSLGSAQRYLKTLTPAAVNRITGIDNPEFLSEMLDRLVFKHGPHWTIHQYIPPEVLDVNMARIKTVYLRIIGDTHSKFDKYAHKAADAEYSLQVGDMGFDYRYITRIVPADKHKVLGGNHDNYTKGPCPDCQGENCVTCQGKGYIYVEQSKHFLGDYGIWQIPEFEPIFYVRGAWSIDYKYRTPEISWWEDEELPYRQMEKALDFYKETKPEFVVSHTAPFTVVPYIPFQRLFGETIHKPRTETLLDAMYDIWQPKIWLYGHFHLDWEKVMIHPRTGKETRFICLNELSYKDFPKKGEEVNGR